MVEAHYDPEHSVYSPDQYIELSQSRRSAIAVQIRDLRHEYDDLLAEEIRVRVEALTNYERVNDV